MARIRRLCVPLVAVAVTTACADAGSRPAAEESSTGRSAAASAPPSPSPSPGGEQVDAPVTAPAAEAPVGPLAPPPGPASVRTTPTGPPVPGTLQTVTWAARAPGDAGCADARAGVPSYGDLDGDGSDEAAVPVLCASAPGPWEVLVYTGDADAARLLGKVLTAEEDERVHAVEFRDRYLVVTTLAYSPQDRRGDPDTAVTSRWVLSSAALQRTDRWVDPAHVLETDAD
jgi:hypothetical protein